MLLRPPLRSAAPAPLLCQRRSRAPAPPHASASGATFPGRYGRWTLTEEDVREVVAYRASLTAFAASFDVCALATLLPPSARDAVLDPAATVGAASLAVALFLVHMYVDELKKVMQALAATGCAGALALSATQHVPVPLYVHDHAAAVWAVGPFFAALTGLAFKEGACYGKGESVALFFLIPALLLARLGDAPDGVTGPLLAVDAALITVWAARKWTQEVKDDIGDKSVFTFRTLPAEEQARLEASLRAAELDE